MNPLSREGAVSHAVGESPSCCVAEAGAALVWSGWLTVGGGGGRLGCQAGCMSGPPLCSWHSADPTSEVTVRGLALVQGTCVALPGCHQGLSLGCEGVELLRCGAKAVGWLPGVESRMVAGHGGLLLHLSSRL